LFVGLASFSGVGPIFIRSLFEWSFYFVLRGGYAMRTYWYVSLNNKYPKPMKGQHRRVVMSVQMKAKYSIVEMTREATPVETDHCKLVYCGYGHWKEDHVQKNISKYI